MAEPRRPGMAPGRRLRLSRFLVPLLFAVFLFFILLDMFPALERGLERVTAPDRVQARETCREAALDAARQRATARVIEAGEAHPTEQGWFIEGVVVGEMGTGGAEVRYRFDCYVDGQGRLIGGRRDPEAPEPAPGAP